MATPEEIRRRVQETDTARSARRAAAAQQVGQLSQRRAEIVARLAEVERELGDVVADAQDVIDVDELATFTDLAPSDLTGWLACRKPLRGKRKKPTTTSGAEGDVRLSSGPRTSTRERTPDLPEGRVSAHVSMSSVQN